MTRIRGGNWIISWFKQGTRRQRSEEIKIGKPFTCRVRKIISESLFLSRHDAIGLKTVKPFHPKAQGWRELVERLPWEIAPVFPSTPTWVAFFVFCSSALMQPTLGLISFLCVPHGSRSRGSRQPWAIRCNRFAVERGFNCNAVGFQPESGSKMWFKTVA